MNPLSPFAIIALIAAILATASYVIVIIRSKRELTRMQERLEYSQITLERKLQLARDERDGLLNALSDVFLIIDDAGVINYANSAAHRLFQSKQLNNRPLAETFIDARIRQSLNECLANKTSYQTQVIIPHAHNGQSNDGSKGMSAWLIDAAPMITHDGVTPATRIVMRDITSEYQTEQIRKDFVANASHELRTPMAIISGYLENLLDDDLIDNPSTARRFLSIMRKHSDRISRIVEEMLIISRLESGEENTLNRQAFQIKGCIHDVLERLESMIGQQDAKIRVTLSDESITLYGDRFYWTQVLFNLVENALKQNPRPHLHVEIGCNPTADRLHVWVSDDGIGIPSADLPHIFRRFYRVDKQHTQKEIKGTGLGLSIVKRAVEAHGGTITVTSIPGHETKFLMSLPKQETPVETNSAPSV